MKVLVINQCSTNKGDRAVLFFVLRELARNGVDQITVSASNPEYWEDKPDFPDVAVRVIPSPGDNSHSHIRKVRFVFPVFRITCGHRDLVNSIAGQLSEHEKQDGPVSFVGRALINDKDLHLQFSFLPSKLFLTARIKSAVSFRNEMAVKLAITTTVDNVSATIQ